MKKTAIVLVFTLLFGIVFSANPSLVYAEEDIEYTDHYDGGTMLAKYSSAEIVDMYPNFSVFLAEKLRALETDISVSDFDLNKENLGSIFFSIMCENPDIFYVFPNIIEVVADYNTGKILSIRPDYLFDTDKIPEKIEEFNRQSEIMLSGLDSGWDDITKTAYIHDILAQHTEYDTKYETISNEDYELYRERMRIYTSYGAIVDHNAVCEGYSMAYKYLLSRAGIKSYYIQSIEKRHSWNMVELNGNLYHVDVAHDDPTPDNLGRVNHTNFLKSDEYFTNDGDDEHVNWITNLRAEDTSYDNAWWNKTSTMIYRIGWYDYFVEQNYTSSSYGALKRRDSRSGVDSVVDVIKTHWSVEGNDNAFWDRACSYLTADSEYLYYNDTNSVYRMSIKDGEIKKIYTKPSTVRGDIYGIVFKTDGALYASIKQSPNEKDEIFMLNITVQPDTEQPNTTTSASTTSPPDTTDPTDSSFPTNPTSTTEPTAPSSASPQETKPVTVPTLPSVQPETVSPAVVRQKTSMYLKRTIRITPFPKGKYTFTSDNKKVATVTSKGVITAKKAGKTVITAKGQDMIFKLTVTVKNPKLNITRKTIRKKKSFTLKVTGGSGKIVYKASNRNITISKKGKVTGKKKGKSTITVSVCGIKLKCRVTVR